jgi:hypothetical protein
VKRAALMVLCAVACGAPTSGGIGRVRVALSGTSDTVRFEVPVVATRCADGAGLLVHGERRGQGLLVWLRGGAPPDPGTYPLLTRGDTVATRGAIASVRFMVGDVAHGVTLDDGDATVAGATPQLEIQVRGRGVEMGLAGQRSAELALEHVTVEPDTVPCRLL